MDIRTRYAYREAVVSIIANILIALMKIIAGTAVSSISIIADGVHSISDVGSSVVVILGAKASEKAPDEEHPFGHGRYEYIASLVIYLFLIAVAAEIFLNSVKRILSGEAPFYGEYLMPVYLVLAISIIAKELMARYSLSLAERSGNTMLYGDAWHHRSDSLTTIAVLIGVFMVSRGIFWADAAISMGISFYIGYMGLRMAVDMSATLAGKNAPSEEIEKIRSEALSVEGVMGVHDIYVHDYGHYRTTTLHIEVPAEISAEDAHALARKVEKRIESLTGGSVTAHADIVEDSRAKEAEKRLKDILDSTPEIMGYHRIERHFYNGKHMLAVHTFLNRNMGLEEIHELIHRIDSQLKEDFPDYRVEIHPEPYGEQ